MLRIKVSNGAKIRNQNNQVPHLTQDTDGKVTDSKLDTTNESKLNCLPIRLRQSQVLHIEYHPQADHTFMFFLNMLRINLSNLPIMVLFHTDHQSPESSIIDKCSDSAGFVENCKIFNPFHDVLRFRYETEKKNQLRIFARFDWIRPESPRYCAEFTTMCNNIFGYTEIS